MQEFLAIQRAPRDKLRGIAPRDCSHCNLQQLCLPTGLDQADIERLDSIVTQRRRIDQGASLYGVHDAFTKIYAVRLGYFKTYQLNAQGEPQISGFQMPGDLLGLDAIGAERHHSAATALEDSEVCEIPFDRLESLLGDVPSLLRRFHRLVGQEIAREHNTLLMLATMRAEQRMAVFLTDIGARQAARGYSAHHFQLRMMREEVGNYLGLTVESVCRLIARLRKSGVVRVEQREVEVLQPDRLRAVAAGTARLD